VAVVERSGAVDADLGVGYELVGMQIYFLALDQLSLLFGEHVFVPDAASIGKT
jgi:hypothetical protein